VADIVPEIVVTLLWQNRLFPNQIKVFCPTGFTGFFGFLFSHSPASNMEAEK
jgi:hypothetical protein